MKKVIKLGVMLVGGLSLIIGFISCKKDKVEKHECCSWTDAGHTYKYCEDDTYVKDSGYTWDVWKDYLITEYSATCANEPK